MILAHQDSNGERWYFRINGPQSGVAVVARKLNRAAARVRSARNGSRRELSRAMLAEAVALSDLQAYSPATPEEYAEAPEQERFIL